MNFKIVDGVMIWPNGGRQPASDEELALWERVAELEAENENLRMLHDADAAAIGQMARKALKSGATPHPDTVRLEKLAKDLNEYRKCAHGRKITNESGASRLYNEEVKRRAGGSPNVRLNDGLDREPRGWT